jgi:site-specific recombinase XerC
MAARTRWLETYARIAPATQDVASLNTNPEFRRAGNSVVAAYGSGFDRDAERSNSPGIARRRTRSAGYRADWQDFCSWCESNPVGPLPASPETVPAYIAECAGRLKVGSIQRRLNAIAEAHQATGLDSPTSAGLVRNTLKGIRRTLETAARPKSPTLTDDIRAMVDATHAGLIGARDRALILLGFAGAFRRSELVGLDIADCAFGKDGLTVTLRRSKTDQEGAGRKIGIPYGSNPETCPVRTIRAWLEQAGIGTGPLFRSISRHGHVQLQERPNARS